MIYALLWKSVSGFIFHHQAHGHGGGEEARWGWCFSDDTMHSSISDCPRPEIVSSQRVLIVFLYFISGPGISTANAAAASLAQDSQPASMSYSRGTFKHLQELLSRTESFIVRDRNKHDFPQFDE